MKKRVADMSEVIVQLATSIARKKIMYPAKTSLLVGCWQIAVAITNGSKQACQSIHSPPICPKTGLASAGCIIPTRTLLRGIYEVISICRSTSVFL